MSFLLNLDVKPAPDWLEGFRKPNMNIQSPRSSDNTLLRRLDIFFLTFEIVGFSHVRFRLLS